MAERIRVKSKNAVKDFIDQFVSENNNFNLDTIIDLFKKTDVYNDFNSLEKRKIFEDKDIKEHIEKLHNKNMVTIFQEDPEKIIKDVMGMIRGNESATYESFFYKNQVGEMMPPFFTEEEFNEAKKRLNQKSNNKNTKTDERKEENKMGKKEYSKEKLEMKIDQMPEDTDLEEVLEIDQDEPTNKELLMFKIKNILTDKLNTKKQKLSKLDKLESFIDVCSDEEIEAFITFADYISENIPENNKLVHDIIKAILFNIDDMDKAVPKITIKSICETFKDKTIGESFDVVKEITVFISNMIHDNKDMLIKLSGDNEIIKAINILDKIDMAKDFIDKNKEVKISDIIKMDNLIEFIENNDLDAIEDNVHKFIKINNLFKLNIDLESIPEFNEKLLNFRDEFLNKSNNNISYKSNNNTRKATSKMGKNILKYINRASGQFNDNDDIEKMEKEVEDLTMKISNTLDDDKERNRLIWLRQDLFVKISKAKRKSRMKDII